MALAGFAWGLALLIKFTAVLLLPVLMGFAAVVADPRGLLELLGMGRRFRGMRSHDRLNQMQLLTMSAIDFLDQPEDEPAAGSAETTAKVPFCSIAFDSSQGCRTLWLECPASRFLISITLSPRKVGVRYLNHKVVAGEAKTRRW